MATGLPGLVANPIPNLEAQLEDLKSRGLDPSQFSICAPSAGTKGAIKGIAGCRHYYRCIFGRKEFGRGKGKGVHTVPYYRDPHDRGSIAGERTTNCQWFMQMLDPIRRAGIDAIEQGLNGDEVEILMDPDRPLELAKSVIETGLVRIDPLDEKKGYHRVDTERLVLKFKFPQEMENLVVSKVKDRRAARLRRDPDSASYVEQEEAPDAVETLDLTGGSEEATEGKGRRGTRVQPS